MRAIVEHIVADREAGGPFADFYDFCRRVDPSRAQQERGRVAREGGRLRLARPSEEGSMPRVRRDHRAGTRPPARVGAGDLDAVLPPRRRAGDPAGGSGSAASYDGTWVAIPDLEFDKAERLAFEKEMLGLYVSDHR